MSLSRKNCPRIPRIGCIYLSGSDEDDARCASSTLRDGTIIVAGCIKLFSDKFELFFTLFATDYLVYFTKSFNESLSVFFLFVEFKVFQLGDECFFYEFRNLDS